MHALFRNGMTMSYSLKPLRLETLLIPANEDNNNSHRLSTGLPYLPKACSIEKMMMVEDPARRDMETMAGNLLVPLLTSHKVTRSHALIVGMCTPVRTRTAGTVKKTLASAPLAGNLIPRPIIMVGTARKSLMKRFPGLCSRQLNRLKIS